MAERGGEAPNPFSFKKFVNKQDKKVTKDVFSDDEDDIFGTSTVQPKKPEKAATADTGKLSKKTDKQKSKPKENPFSFKKFLSDPNKSADQNASIPPDLASDLPSFVQDHFTEREAVGGEDDLDFALTSHDRLTPPPHHPSTSSSLKIGASSLPLLLDTADDIDQYSLTNSQEEQDRAEPPLPGLQLGLPDFLSDGAVLNAKASPKELKKTIDQFSGDRDKDLLSQIRIIQKENERLRQELSEEKLRCGEKNQKLSQLKIDLERQKKKELEETAVLERAVQQVEENLVTTTKRAVQAESLAAKLKQEVKALQNQVKILTAENEMYKSGDGGLSDLRERTKYSSEQLKMAATSAEQNLKELMAGVDKLKLLSVVLSSLEKVSEVSPDQAGKSEPS